MKYIKQLPGTPIDPRQINANLDTVSNELDMIERKINSLLMNIDNGLRKNREELYEHLKSLSQTKSNLIGKISYYEYIISRYNKEFDNLISINNIIIDYLNSLGNVIESSETFEDVLKSITQPPEQASMQYEPQQMPNSIYTIFPTLNSLSINPSRTILTKDFGAFTNRKSISFDYITSVEDQDDFVISGDYNDLKNPDYSGMVNIQKYVDSEIEYVPFTVVFEQFKNNAEENEEPFNVKGISFVPQSNSYSEFNDLALGEMFLESIKIYGKNGVTSIVTNEKVYSMGEYTKYFGTQDLQKIELNFVQPNNHIETNLENKDEFVYDVGLYYFQFIMEDEQTDTQTYAFQFNGFNQQKVYDYVVNGDINKNDVLLYTGDNNSQVPIVGRSISKNDIIKCQINRDNFYINNIVIFYD